MAEHVENVDDLIEPGEGSPEDLEEVHDTVQDATSEDLELVAMADDEEPAAEESEGEPSGAQAEAQEKPTISEPVLRVAEAAGLTREQASQFASEQDVLLAAEMLMRNRGAAQQPAIQMHPGQSAQPTAQQPAQEAATQTPEFKIELPEDFDPELAEPLNNALRQVASHYEQRIQQLQQTLASFAYQQQQQYIDRFNQDVRSLGDEFSDIFGTDSFEDLTPADPHYQNWLRVDEEMRKEAAMLAQQGRALSQSRLFRNAVARLWPEKFRSPGGRKLAKELKKRANLISPRPTGRDSERELPADLRAKRAVARKMREMGLL